MFGGGTLETLTQLAQRIIATGFDCSDDLRHHGTDIGFVVQGGPGQGLGLPGGES